MEFCNVPLEEPQPDMVCPSCRRGIDAYEDGYETSGSLLNGMPWDVRCKACGHVFQAVAETTVRWTIIDADNGKAPNTVLDADDETQGGE